MSRRIAIARGVAILGFLALLSATYQLRSEVLALNRIRFSADNVRADYQLRRLKESYPAREEQHRVALRNYEIQEQHYREMAKLYENNYEEYVKRLKDKYEPPQMPARPQPPDPPEVEESLARINAEFRVQKYHYFRTIILLNGVAWASATALVGTLLALMMFDQDGRRWQYAAVLGLSFAFLIGPSFHSILSLIAGFLRAPDISP